MPRWIVKLAWGLFALIVFAAIVGPLQGCAVLAAKPACPVAQVNVMQGASGPWFIFDAENFELLAGRLKALAEGTCDPAIEP